MKTYTYLIEVPKRIDAKDAVGAWTMGTFVGEVVRCKECKHNKTSDCAMWYEDVTYEMQYSWNNPNDFCSYGERSDK